MSIEITTVYSARADQYRAKQKGYTTYITLLSLCRFLLFAGFAWFLIAAFRIRFQGDELLHALLFIIGFLGCVFWAGSFKKKNTFLQQMILINENENNVQKGQSSFLSNGALFAPAKGFANDLTVFGPHSLFHLLNRTGSLTGAKQLSGRLLSPFLEPADIENYQSCVQELAGKLDFRQTLLAYTLLLEEEKALEQLQSGIPTEGFAVLKNAFWTMLALCWPVAGILIIFFSSWKGSYQWMLAFIIFGLLLLSFILKKVNLLYYHISKRRYLYTQYARCFQLITIEKFRHPYLIKKQEDIAQAADAFKRLSRLTGLFDLRLSILSLFINGLFLFDLLCSRSYINWNNQYQAQIKKWFDALGEIELLNSLATFHYNHPEFIFPQCTGEQILVKAKAMGHPLMNPAVAVLNDISIGETVTLHLITGSNMSGKSTFLRTVGLNIILAQSGAPVFAEYFLFRPARLLTSFHHIDSLEENTSYFYAELKCLQAIIDALSHPEPALVLLDEVMRGTNSKDKHDGTALLIKKILNYPALSLIATHDTELGSLAESHPGKIENFCFESELSDTELNFDFRVRKGVAQTKNATYLMRKMGII